MNSENIYKKLIHTLYNFFSRIPVIGMLAKRLKINRNFSIERKVLKGKHQSSCRHQSILFFSLHRAGSTFIGGLLKKIAAEIGLTAVDLDSYFYELGKGKEWEGEDRIMLKVPYQSTGYLYGPFRSFNREISNIVDYKIILVLRDPRDVIVSAYYSRHSHVTPSLEGQKAHQIRMNRRKSSMKQTVDEFVISKTNDNPRFLNMYYQYHKELIGKSNVLFLKYEDMVENFDSWLDQLIGFLSIEISREFIDQIKTETSFKVSREDISRHRRQVIPGDHKRKLKPETIEFLNKKTEKILESFGYKERIN